MSLIARFTIVSMAIHISLLAAFSLKLQPARQLTAVEWVVDLSTELRNDGGKEEPVIGAALQTDRLMPQPDQKSQPVSEFPKESKPDEELIHDPAVVIPAVEKEVTSTDSVAGKLPLAIGSINAVFQNSMNNQAILMQMSHFFRIAGSSVKGMVDRALINNSDRMAMSGQNGIVKVAYLEGGNVDTLSIETGNPELRKFLTERILWDLAPSPKSCSLPFRKVMYSISLAGSRIKVAVSPG
jgi:hypothetical protein